MSDQAEAKGPNPDYVPPEFKPETEREHQARNVGFSAGYFEGRNDILQALASRAPWADELLQRERALLRSGASSKSTEA